MVNPAALLTMAYRGVGAFSEPQPVRVIAVIPSGDSLAFGVAARTGISSFDELRERKVPLKISTRGSHDPAVEILVNQVLGTYGVSLGDIDSWGGRVTYDQPIAGDDSRIGAYERGEIDGIFDEAIRGWVGRGSRAGMNLLSIDEPHLQALEKIGFRRGKIAAANYPGVVADVPTVDFSGWPIFTSLNASEKAIRAFCYALDARKDRLIYEGAPLPLAKMVSDSPDGPLDVPLHPVAEQCWREMGYIK
jgi:TRAP-type uncharacterized transport system substrate-binding protein